MSHCCQSSRKRRQRCTVTTDPKLEQPMDELGDAISTSPKSPRGDRSYIFRSAFCLVDYILVLIPLIIPNNVWSMSGWDYRCLWEAKCWQMVLDLSTLKRLKRLIVIYHVDARSPVQSVKVYPLRVVADSYDTAGIR